jgi:hypothetical protein
MTGTATRSTRVLTNLATLLLVVSVGFGLMLLAGAVGGFAPGSDVAAHADVPGSQLRGFPHDTVVPDHVDVVVRLRHPTHEQVRWANGRDLVPLLVMLAGLWLVRQLLVSVRDSGAFSEDNVRRLRILALLVLVGTPIALTIRSMFETSLATSAGLHGPGTELSLPGGAVIGGLTLLVLAEVFASGVRMRTDLEGTV